MTRPNMVQKGEGVHIVESCVVFEITRCSCSFGVIMEAEAAMTIHSQRWGQFSWRPNAQPQKSVLFYYITFYI